MSTLDQVAAARPDVLITGIPRSGTSYFCTVLHNLEDCVAINEPEEIFEHLNDTAPPWGMAAYYARLRADILAGRPVLNKIHEGRLIEDTAVILKDEPYVPAVAAPTFLLATKNTLAYLARLPYLAAAMPKATRIAFVRNPYETIASWKGTFGHLAGATVRQIRLGFVGDPLLQEAARKRLEAIDAEQSVEVKRAMFWRHLALMIEEGRDCLAEVVRYEDLVSDPEATLRRLISRVPDAPPFRPLRPFVPSSARKKRIADLGPADIEAIRRVCGERARAFGYDLDQLPSPAGT